MKLGRGKTALRNWSMDSRSRCLPNLRMRPSFRIRKHRRKGVGLPIARVVAILSLATAAVMDAAIGPYQGKETGESALLRSLLPSLLAGDIAVFDRYYCSFMMIALLQLQGVDVCARLHHKRKSDFRKGERLGKDDLLDRLGNGLASPHLDFDLSQHRG